MTDHAVHERSADGYPILCDGCPRCEEHAASGIAFDAERIERFWLMMVAVERGADEESFGRFSGYASDLDHRLGRRLYETALLMERYMGLDPWCWPPRPVCDETNAVAWAARELRTLSRELRIARSVPDTPTLSDGLRLIADVIADVIV